MSNCRQPGRDARAQAESQAQAIIAQGRRMARREAAAPGAAGRPASGWRAPLWRRSP